VGDNVGDTAGMGADIFESYVGSVIATIAIGATSAFYMTNRAEAVALPILTIAVGLVASLIGIALMRVLEGSNPAAALRNVTFIASGLFLVTMYFVIAGLSFDLQNDSTGETYRAMGPFWALLAGSLAGIVIGLITEYYTAGKPVRRIADSSQTGYQHHLRARGGDGIDGRADPLHLPCHLGRLQHCRSVWDRHRRRGNARDRGSDHVGGCVRSHRRQRRRDRRDEPPRPRDPQDHRRP
jgi:K(+)-stimulated pyrophosphate-energized sodium pump